MTLAERLAAAFLAAPSGTLLPGDHPDIADDATLIEAAVLVPITDRPNPGVILTQRTETLRAHAGQVSFPGGRIDAGEDAVVAALREADEEVALAPNVVDVIGLADRYRTGTGFSITPVVGVIPPDLTLVPSEAEVAAVFEVPLEFLLAPQNHRQASAVWQGRERQYYEILWEDRRIWGATAAMIVNLSRRLQW